MNKIMIFLSGFMCFLVAFLGACAPSDGNATPTLLPEQIQTMAVATFSSGLTQTAIAFPTETPSPSPTSTSTISQTNTPETSPTQSGAGMPTTSCYRLSFVSDITIPDNTKMGPGEIFTKTWRVRNSGSCAWEIGFKFMLTYGDAIGGAALTLDKSVSPGEEKDLSIVMTAPNNPGSYQGNWRMTTANGTFFGDEVYVLIVVDDDGAKSPTATGTQIPNSTTPTITATVEETAES